MLGGWWARPPSGTSFGSPPPVYTCVGHSPPGWVAHLLEGFVFRGVVRRRGPGRSTPVLVVSHTERWSTSTSRDTPSWCFLCLSMTQVPRWTETLDTAGHQTIPVTSNGLVDRLIHHIRVIWSVGQCSLEWCGFFSNLGPSGLGPVVDTSMIEKLPWRRSLVLVPVWRSRMQASTAGVTRFAFTVMCLAQV